MPSQRPSAAFEPISPDLDLQQLVEETSNFEYVTRISCDMIEEQGHDTFDKLVLLHVILGGKPLVIEGFNQRLDEWTFTSPWLQDNCGKKFEQARNLTKQQNMPLSIGHYLSNVTKLTDQWTRDNYKEPDRQRIYLKDIDCPQIWHDKLKEQVPPSVFYLNESTGEYGGPGSVEAVPGKDTTKGQGVARAGDLMSVLPPPMRADNMMCYIGHEGTYTPAHREMCASLGQNLMVETSGSRDETGKPNKPGSSIWFMTETNDRHMVSEYWLSILGHDIEVENHFAQINAWKLAPFKTYIVDQRAGDFILIPPLAPHQVWNRGTRTMKAAWNRTTVETLEMALHEALPRARMVCRDEQYKNKAIVYFALQKYSDLLKQVEVQRHSPNAQIRSELEKSLKIRQLQKDFRRLFALYTEVLVSEMLAPVDKAEKRGQYLPYDSFVTCSYCRCNIFNRFLTCTSCVNTLENGDQDTYDICMDCFAMGRSCWCISKYKWVEQFPWQELVQRHDAWRQQIIDFDGGVSSKTPKDLQTSRKNLGKKTIAQVCQEQLKARPWQDPKKPAPVMTTKDRRFPGRADPDKEETEVRVDDDGNVKKSKSKKTRAEMLPKGMAIEHVSLYSQLQWKLAACTKCDRFFSYGSLYRMFDLMPQEVMQNPEWECPACRNTCSCGACRKRKTNKPYEPKGTVLGHDTKKVADPRSVESLVNYSLPNTHFIKVAGDDHSHQSRRLSRRKDEAEKAKAQDPNLDEHYVEDGLAPAVSQDTDADMPDAEPGEPEIPIDPMLSMDPPQWQINSRVRRRLDDDYVNSRSQSRDGSVDWGANDRRDDSPGHHVAPFARMIDYGHQGEHFVSNGITYEYPDPTVSQSVPPIISGPYEPPVIPRDLSLLQSDSNSNGLGQLSQLEQMLEDARQNDRYISTEATFTGKSLRITLFLTGSKLATIANTIPRPSTLSNGVQAHRKEPPILLQSDYPSASQPKQPAVPKKKRTRKEVDNDFSTRKRPDRRSSATKAIAAKDTRRMSAKYAEISSDSEVEAPEEVSSSFVPINKTQGSRPLPKYLAKRTEEEDLPASLDELASWKTSATQNGSKSQPEASIPNPPPKHASNALLSKPGTGTKTKADIAQKRAEDNAKAKMKALHWEDDNDDDMNSGSDSLEVPAKPKGGLLAIPKSIFSRARPNGKKAKIVSAKSASTNDKAAKEAMRIARRSLDAL
jgi:hypothetical protein